ncbi:MAG TPA: prolyl oligopeptidase family serine peptidase [Terriglobales bacterium]|nr:prolyl oligopeptidase family serine peptidase [Terriglobales bacterium]
MTRTIVASAILLLCLTTTMTMTSFARNPETGFLNRTISVGGETYRYQVFIPANWNKRGKWPVILFLHGAGERGDDGLLQTDVGIGHAIRQTVARFPFVVVMPQCRKEKTWTQPEMQAQALAALDRAMKEFRGDPARVYLTGLSMGGFGTWDLAAKYPRRFAALVVVCGGITPPKMYPQMGGSLVSDPRIADPYGETARLIGSTPVWIFHGDADPAVPVEESRKMYAALQAAHGNVKYTEYPGVGHESWLKAYADPDLPIWLLQQHLH